MDGPTNDRNDWAARTNGLADGPSRRNVLTMSSAAMALRARASANSGSSGTRIRPSSITRSPRTAGGGLSRPWTHSDSWTAAASPSHSTCPASITADHPEIWADGSVRSTPWTVTRSVTRRPRSEPATLWAWGPPHPSARRNTAGVASGGGGGGPPAAWKPPHRDGRYRPRLLFRLEQAGLIQGIATHPIGWSQDPQRCEGDGPTQPPTPHHA